jgi:sec-independent protein translocase protein TatA
VIEGMFQPMHLLLILGIVLLLFGPSKLAGLGKGLGDGIRGFKESLQEAEPSPVKQSTDPTLAHEHHPAKGI